ncbi:MAG: hypothetical protein ACRC7O_03760 [Fimbriiglobus sp.]
MPFAVSLPPDLEARLTAEAARAGVPPEKYAAALLTTHLPADRAAAAVALLDGWLAEPDPSDQHETGDVLVHRLDDSRSGQRPHFPRTAEGRTW